MKKISKICSGIGLFFAVVGLIMGLTSIGAEGFDKLGVILIFPSIAAILIILQDRLIAKDKYEKGVLITKSNNRNGLLYSCMSTILKVIIIIIFISSAIDSYKHYGEAYSEIIILIIFVIITIPYVLNIIKILKNQKNQNDNI